MKEEEILRNLKTIRETLQNLQVGMHYLLKAVFPDSSDGGDEDGDLSLNTPKLKTEQIDKIRSYLG